MIEIADITLDGDPYLLVPGGYERATDNPVSPEPGRLVLSQFERGLGVTFDDSPDEPTAGGWSGQAVHSLDGGAGLEPWPGAVSYSDATLVATPTTAIRAFHQAAGNAVYIAMGRYFYESPALNALSWTGLTLRHTLAAGQAWTDATYYRDDVLLPRGGAADALRWDTGTATMSTWRVGESGTIMQGYNGAVIYNQGTTGLREQLSFGILHNNGTAIRRARMLDAPQVRLGMYAGKVAVATKQSLYLVAGQVSEHEAGSPNSAVQWNGDPEPLFTHGSWIDEAAGDLRFLVSYFGRLYTWLGSSVVEYGGSEQGWLRLGPRGRSCYGACVAGSYLVVALESHEAQAELWAYDGLGWWLIASGPAPGGIWPVALAGAGGYDLLVFASGSPTYRLYRLSPRGPTLPSFAGTASWTSPLLTAGNPDTTKVWRRFAASFSLPEAPGNPASADSVTVWLDYSLDAGATWITAATAATTITRLVDLEFTPVPPPVSRVLQLRVRWESVVDWAPILTGLVADYVTIDTAPRRQKWTLDVQVRDQLPGSGRQQIDSLWDAYRTGAIVSYRDIDYQNTPVPRQVRILDITEAAPAESAGEAWSGGIVKLLLSEV